MFNIESSAVYNVYTYGFHFDTSTAFMENDTISSE